MGTGPVLREAGGHSYLLPKKGLIMKGQTGDPEYHISKNRLETLVDGIFAFAMTLLVLGINPPRPEEAQATAVLPSMIESLVPEVFLFILAFLVLAMFWLGHHRQFHFVSRIDPALLWINILILISIVFVPFSTDIAGDYPSVTDAALLFHANMFIVGFLFSFQWHHICRHGHLCEPVPDTAIVQGWFNRTLLVPVIAFTGGILCFFYPALSLLVYLTLPGWTCLLDRVPFT
jgi:TMEM175 potassium channel family protein